jgi:hypothetical protein
MISLGCKTQAITVSRRIPRLNICSSACLEKITSIVFLLFVLQRKDMAFLPMKEHFDIEKRVNLFEYCLKGVALKLTP